MLQNSTVADVARASDCLYVHGVLASVSQQLLLDRAIGQKATQRKKIDIKGRGSLYALEMTAEFDANAGRVGIRKVYASHLLIALREQPQLRPKGQLSTCLVRL